jgi:hypothetical protein
MAQVIAREHREPQQRSWAIARRMIESYLSLSALIWLGMLVVVTAIIVGIAYWDTVRRSIWDDAVNTAPQWWAAIIAGYAAFQFLPATISHGGTRREFGIQATMFSIIFAAGLAVMVAIGFLLEAALYGVMDWPRGVTEGHIFTSGTQVHLILIEYAFKYLVWVAAGALVGAAFYRSDDFGWSIVGFVWIPVSLSEMALGLRSGTPITLLNRVWEPPTVPAVLALAISLAMAAVIAAVGWYVIRDVPMRSKSE